MIHALVKKPQAFRHYQLRNELLPSLGYKVIWVYVDKHMGAKKACKFIVGLLHLAATESCEVALAQAVLEQIDEGKPLSLSALQMPFIKRRLISPAPQAVDQYNLATYNHYIPKAGEVTSHVSCCELTFVA